MTEWMLTVLKGASQISGFPESREVPLVPATFALGGTSSSGAAIVYSVPNTDVITISGGMATITDQGTVVVTATVLATANWEGVTQQQTLMVSDKMGQTLTFAPLPDKRVGDSPFLLSATSSEPSLTSSITFSSSEESVATVAGFTVTVVGSGMTDIRATQGGERRVCDGECGSDATCLPSRADFWFADDPVPELLARHPDHTARLAGKRRAGRSLTPTPWTLCLRA